MVKVVDVLGLGQPKRVVNAIRLHLAGSPLFNLLLLEIEELRKRGRRTVQ